MRRKNKLNSEVMCMNKINSRMSLNRLEALMVVLQMQVPVVASLLDFRASHRLMIKLAMAFLLVSTWAMPPRLKTRKVQLQWSRGKKNILMQENRLQINHQ